MQLAKMVVLGTLERLGNASGYDIFQYLGQNMIDKWTDIQKPSVYHALRQLEKEAAIKPVEQTRDGRYPEKIIYRITSEGQHVFDKLQEQAFLGIFPRFFGFKIALKFNTRRSAEEIGEYAKQAIIVIDKYLAAMDAYLAKLDKESGQYRFDSFFIDHDRRLFLEEKKWISDAVIFSLDSNTVSKKQEDI